MTLSPKEKAEELVDRFYHAKKYANSANAMSIELAKQCAIIACDDMLKTLNLKTGRASQIIILNHLKSHYQQVKTEIENL